MMAALMGGRKTECCVEMKRGRGGGEEGGKILEGQKFV